MIGKNKLLASFLSNCSFRIHFNFTKERFCYFSTVTPQPLITEKPLLVKKTFHKRQLPNNLIALSSPAGKQLFREALHDGTMECFFPLSEQFVTQSDPSYCSLSTLAMVLNALNFDPKRVWKGPWRWVSEEMLQCETQDVCGHSLEKVKKSGLSFSEFESLAKCHGVKIISKRACPTNHGTDFECNNGLLALEEFRTIVEQHSIMDQAKSFVVTNYSRKSLNQTGDGHYSPIGGYHKQKDLVLILDVARFKYPPYWLPVKELWESMAINDAATGKPRGYYIISAWDEDLFAQVGQIFPKTDCPPLIRTWNSAIPVNKPSTCLTCDHHLHH